MQKKALVSILVLCGVVVISILVLWLTGAFSKKVDEMLLKDISGFEKLVDKPSSIHVLFRDEYDGEFTIIDEVQINTIYELLMNRSYAQRKKGDLKPPGSNRRITFIYADSIQISFDPSWVLAKDGRRYTSPIRDFILDKYLEEIGLLQGAIVQR